MTRTLTDLPDVVFILDVRLKKTAVGGSRQEFLIDGLGDILILVDRTDNKLHLKHITFMLITNPFNLPR